MVHPLPRCAVGVTDLPVAAHRSLADPDTRVAAAVDCTPRTDPVLADAVTSPTRDWSLLDVADMVVVGIPAAAHYCNC